MKRILYLFLENGPHALKVLETVKGSGFNGTLVGAASIKHALEEKLPEEHSFFSLYNWEAESDKESTFSMYIVEEEHLAPLKQAIRAATKDFREVKGAMFSLPIEDYEGTLTV